MQLLWKRGFEPVSARDLAEAMSIQRSSFYNSFGSREAIFREALARYAAAAPDSPLDHLEPGEPAIPLLVDVFRRACRARAADPGARGCLVCNSVAELVGVHEQLGPLLEGAVRERVGSVERLLRQAAAQGELTEPTDCAAVARSIVAFLMGLNTLSKVVRSGGHLWAMSRSFLAGLGLPEQALGPAARTPSAGRSAKSRSRKERVAARSTRSKGG